jgi:hypothetical protein
MQANWGHFVVAPQIATVPAIGLCKSAHFSEIRAAHRAGIMLRHNAMLNVRMMAAGACGECGSGIPAGRSIDIETNGGKLRCAERRLICRRGTT